MRLRSNIPRPIAIQGSYTTGNVGDLAIGKAISSWFASEGISATLFSHRIDSAKAELRILGGGGVIHDRDPVK